MVSPDKIEAAAEPLMDLLAAQCADLEALLSLARREEAAAGRGDFEEVMSVVIERATLGERLETYHRRISEMRERLEDSGNRAIASPAARRVASLVVEIQATDSRTTPLLAAARTDAVERVGRLDTARRTGSYLNQQRSSPIACDRRV
jgi:hypothetical protein